MGGELRGVYSLRISCTLISLWNMVRRVISLSSLNSEFMCVCGSGGGVCARALYRREHTSFRAGTHHVSTSKTVDSSAKE